MVFTYANAQELNMNHHLKTKNKQRNVHKCPDTNLHLVVEPDVHEEAVHVGPEQRRANQMRQTLQEEKSQTSGNATKVQQSQRTIDLAQIIEAARLVPMFLVYIPPSSRFKTVRVSSFCWKQ